jgi:hypothetical protein
MNAGPFLPVRVRRASLGDLEREEVGAPVGPGGGASGHTSYGPGGVGPMIGPGAGPGGGLGMPGPALAPVNNANYSPSPVTLAAWGLQTFLIANPNRRTLHVQNRGLGALYVLFQNVSTALKSYSASASSQAELTALAATSIMLDPATATTAGGSFEAYVTPNGAITLLALGTATTGVIIEGI